MASKSQSAQSQSRHIRPKVRSRNPNPRHVCSADEDGSTPLSMTATTTTETPTAVKKASPKSILRKPKYSHSHKSDAAVPPPTEGTNTTTTTVTSAGAMNDRVMERDPASFARTTTVGNSVRSDEKTLAVEGYVPKVAVPNPKVEQSDEPLVFSSLSELLSVAGTTQPASDSNNETKGNPQHHHHLVEADLSFSCMTLQDYEYQQTSEQSTKDTDGDKENNCNEDADGEDPLTEIDEHDSEDDLSADDLFDFDLQEGSEEEAVVREPRAFTKLWSAMLSWITPEACSLLQHWRCEKLETRQQQNWVHPVVLHSDLEASRCAGLMAILKMHLSRTLQELQRPTEATRHVEKRLADFLRTLHYAEPMVKLDTKLWRAMTCVLLDMVLVEERSSLPESIKSVGMTHEEYRYLTQRAVTSLDSGIYSTSS